MSTSDSLDEKFDSAELWAHEARILRDILCSCDLTEELKWNKPCYTHDGKNICIIQRMKNFLALMFFNGALIQDDDGLLREQGPNSQSAFRMEFTSPREIENLSANIKAFVVQAIENEKKGLKIEGKAELNIPEELAFAFDDDPDFRAAFEALTPGRQRGYCLHFSQPKKAETRANRIEKYREKIFAGKGFQDR